MKDSYPIRRVLRPVALSLLLSGMASGVIDSSDADAATKKKATPTTKKLAKAATVSVKPDYLIIPGKDPETIAASGQLIKIGAAPIAVIVAAKCVNLLPSGSNVELGHYTNRYPWITVTPMLANESAVPAATEQMKNAHVFKVEASAPVLGETTLKMWENVGGQFQISGTGNSNVHVRLSIDNDSIDNAAKGKPITSIGGIMRQSELSQGILFDAAIEVPLCPILPDYAEVPKSTQEGLDAFTRAAIFNLPTKVMPKTAAYFNNADLSNTFARP